MSFIHFRRSVSSRLISLFLLIAFTTSMVITPKASYAGVMGLPQPGTMVNLSPAYTPLMLTGLTVHPENPLLMDFIVSTGDSGIKADQIKQQSDRLIKYFLACLTIPENNQWVNLSPYEKQRIIPEDLGKTVLGRDMLAQDYLLKQLTASLIYPEKNLGKTFWDEVYAKASRLYGTTHIPMNTFNKVWILPETAKVYVHNNTVFVVKSHLKVMLDEDYLAMVRHSEGARSATEESKGTNNLGSQLVRQIILPAIEQEVNTGKNFAQMRQIYNSMVLAVWFKKNLRQALLNQVYSDKSKINGVNVDDPSIKEKIYQQYIEAYKRGVFNYIKEEVDQTTQQTIPRKYFSGGLTPERNLAMATDSEFEKAVEGLHQGNDEDFLLKGNVGTTPAMLTQPIQAQNILKGQILSPRFFPGVKIHIYGRDINDVYVRIEHPSFSGGGGWTDVSNVVRIMNALSDNEQRILLEQTIKNLRAQANSAMSARTFDRFLYAVTQNRIKEVFFQPKRGSGQIVTNLEVKGRSVIGKGEVTPVEITQRNFYSAVPVSVSQAMTVPYVPQSVAIGSSPEDIDEPAGKATSAAMATPVQVAKGVSYWRGEIKPTPITRPFRASRQEDVPDISQIPLAQALRWERLALNSLLRGEGVIALLAAGASSRMNVKFAPEDVRSMAHGILESKAGVPIGTVDGQVINYLDAFGMNASRLFQQIGQEAESARQKNVNLAGNDVLLFSNEDYQEEQNRIIIEHNNYGLPQKIRFFNQPLDPIYWATPADVEKLKNKFNTEADFHAALQHARNIQARLEAGEKSAIIVPNQRDPLGHGEFYHQLIVSGELLRMFETGKKWYFFKNVDNYAAKFDRVWLQTLGRFLEQQLDFQPEVSPRSPGQTGGSLIVMEDTGNQQLAEDPTLKATLGPDGKPKVSPSDSFWFNDAVAFGRPAFVASLYFKQGQSLQEFLKEYNWAFYSHNRVALEAIAERGRSKFPKLIDPKVSKDGTGGTIKIETNSWQATGVVPETMKIKAIGVLGARNFNINEYPSMSPEQQIKELSKLRMLSTKQWTVTAKVLAEIKQKLETLLGRAVTEPELDLIEESYEGNKRISDALLHYILHADLITRGILSTGETSAAMTAAQTGVPDLLEAVRNKDSMLLTLWGPAHRLPVEFRVGRQPVLNFFKDEWDSISSRVNKVIIRSSPQSLIVYDNHLEEEALAKTIQRIGVPAIFVFTYPDQTENVVITGQELVPGAASAAMRTVTVAPDLLEGIIKNAPGTSGVRSKMAVNFDTGEIDMDKGGFNRPLLGLWARAFAEVFSEEGLLKPGSQDAFAVAYDGRPKSDEFMDYFARVLRAYWPHVVKGNSEATTPTGHRISALPGIIATITGTASHNPLEFNGFKFSMKGVVAPDSIFFKVYQRVRQYAGNPQGASYLVDDSDVPFKEVDPVKQTEELYRKEFKGLGRQFVRYLLSLPEETTTQFDFMYGTGGVFGKVVSEILSMTQAEKWELAQEMSVTRHMMEDHFLQRINVLQRKIQVIQDRTVLLKEKWNEPAFRNKMYREGKELVRYRPEPKRFLVEDVREFQEFLGDAPVGSLYLGIDGDADRLAIFVKTESGVFKTTKDGISELAPNYLGFLLGKAQVDELAAKGVKKIIIDKTLPTSYLTESLVEYAQKKYSMEASLGETPVGSKYFGDDFLSGILAIGVEESGHMVLPKFFDDGVAEALTLLQLLAQPKNYGKNLMEVINESLDEVSTYVGKDLKAIVNDRVNLPLKDSAKAFFKTTLEAGEVKPIKDAVTKAIEELNAQDGYGWELEGIFLTTENAKKEVKKVTIDEYLQQKAQGTAEPLKVNEGFKVKFKNGAWTMIRISGTEGVIRLYSEGFSKKEYDGLNQLVSKVVPLDMAMATEGEKGLSDFDEPNRLTKAINELTPTGEEGFVFPQPPKEEIPPSTGEEGKSRDRAMKGGIDLNSRALNLQSEGQKANITFNPAMIAQFKRGDFSGVRIQILDVTPINLMPLLGMREEDIPARLAKI